MPPARMAHVPGYGSQTLSNPAQVCNVNTYQGEPCSLLNTVSRLYLICKPYPGSWFTVLLYRSSFMHNTIVSITNKNFYLKGVIHNFLAILRSCNTLKIYHYVRQAKNGFFGNIFKIKPLGEYVASLILIAYKHGHCERFLCLNSL